MSTHPISRNILVIEDNKDLARLLELHLRDLFYEVDLAYDGITGFAQAEGKHYDLIILDIMLPGLDGLEICRRLRSGSTYIPILMLTSKSSELDRVLGLEIGADDYVVKPFSIRELLARVKAIFRRVEGLKSEREGGEPPILRAGDLTIDPDKRKVTLKGAAVELTAKEFDLLFHFAKSPGKVYTRAQLLDRIWA